MSAVLSYTASDADRIRIAIALAALKYKPPAQSFPSYVLELCTRFQPSTPSAPTTDGSWRTHALSLERDYAELQAKYDAEKIKTLSLASSASAVPLPISSTVLDQSNSSTTKKKPKKKVSATASALPPEKRTHLNRIDLTSALEGLHDRMDIATLPGPDSLFSALNDILLLISLSDVEPTLLLSVALRAIEAIAKMLECIVVRQPMNLSSDINMLETLGAILHHVLSRALPLLASGPLPSTCQTTIPIADPQDPIAVLLERLTTLIFSRLIHAFGPLSETYLKALFLPPIADATNTLTGLKPPLHMHASTQPLPADIRVDVLSLFQTMFLFIDGQLRTLAAIPRLVVVIHTLRASVTLETVRELRRLLVPVPVRLPTSDSEAHCGTTVNTRLGGGAERVKKLAKKDTFWYLCTILHNLFSDPVPASSTSQSAAAQVDHGNREDGEGQGSRRLLDEGISDALLELVTTCRKRVSSCRHGGYLKADRDTPSALEMESDVGEGMGKTKDSHVQAQDAARERDEGQFSRGHLGKCIHEQRSLHAIGMSGAAVGVESHVDRGAGGQVDEDSGKGDHAVSMPRYQLDTADLLEGRSGHNMVELDEISHEMLLGVIERYWTWSKSWSF